MTDLITLPQIIASDETNEDIFIFQHNSDKAALKNKIILQKNLFSLLTSGEKILQYAGKSTLINNRHFVLLSAGNCLMTEKLSTQNNYSSTLLFFDNSILINFFLKYVSIINKIKPEHNELEEPFIVFEKDVFLENYIVSLNLMLQSGQRISLEMKQLKFEELMLHLLNKFPQAVISFQPNTQTVLNDFELKKVVETNIYNNVTIEELAFLCNNSLSTFKRRFAKAYNTSPSKYFLHRKLEKAASLLRENNENPGEVYHKVGYENFSSFSQSFKQLYGISPKVYQQQKLNV